MSDQKLRRCAYRCVIAYEGTEYYGWQVQAGVPTVASVLAETFTTVFGVEGSILGASRTDRGVHAWGQVARLKTPLDLDPELIRIAWNKSLPLSLFVRSIVREDRFHPQHEVLEKEYRYRLFTKRPSPLMARYGWFPVLYSASRFSYERFCETLSLFVGEHDFRHFSKYEPGKEMVRTVTSLTITRGCVTDGYELSSCEQAHDGDCDVFDIVVKGKGFLRFQIRRMIGAAFTIAQTPDFDLEVVRLLLRGERPEQMPAFDKADAAGLLLYEIVYRR